MEAKVIPPPPDWGPSGDAPPSIASTAPPPALPGAPRQLDPVGQLKQTIMGGPHDDPNIVQQAADFLIPGSIPEAAVMAALPFVGRLGGMVKGGTLARDVLLKGGIRSGATVGVGAATGAASASMRGETAEEGAIHGATVGLIPAAVAEVFAGTGSIVEAAARKWGLLDTKAFAGKVRDVVGPVTAKAVTSDIPSLAGKITNDIPGVLGLLDETTGRKLLGQMFDKQEQAMAASMGTKGINIPNEAIELARGMRGPAAQKATAGTENVKVGSVEGGEIPFTPMAPLDAIKLGKALRTKGLNTKDPDARLYRQAADSVTDAVKARATPADAQAYTALQQDYRKFMNLRDFLNQNPDKLFPGMKGKSATMDLVLWGDRLIDNYSSVSPTDFPHLHEVFGGPGGAGSGVRPTASSVPLVGHARMGIPIPGASHMRLYEGGRLPTTLLPEHLQAELGGRFKTRVEQLGRLTGTGATPSAADATQQPP